MYVEHLITKTMKNYANSKNVSDNWKIELTLHDTSTPFTAYT